MRGFPYFFFGADAGARGVVGLAVYTVSEMSELGYFIQGHPVSDALSEAIPKGIAQSSDNGGSIVRKVGCNLPTAPRTILVL